MSVTNSQQINWNIVENYIRKNIPDIPEGTMEVKKFTEGYSNLTYLLTIGDWQAVLRRPPFGYTPPRAHDMEREYNVLRKVNPVYPLAPKPYLYCEDPEIMDKHFYVMEKKTGVVIDEKLPETYPDTPETGKKISQAVVESLVQLQEIDIYEHGLNSLGKPEGYLSRQVNGWIERYKRSKTDEVPYIEEVEKWLADNIPESPAPTIVHNDFKLNNMMFETNDPTKIIGVFDWELATVGDPLTDLGSSLAYWGQKDDPDMGINIVTDKPGFYTRREFLQHYAEKSGRDVSQANYYLTFGFYKLAGILQQIYYRWKTGEVEDDRFSTLNQAVANLIQLAVDAKNNRLL